MRIREVFPGDIQELQELYIHHLKSTGTVGSTPDGYTAQERDGSWPAAIQAIMDDPDYHLLVCEYEGRIVSTVTLVIIKNLTYGLRPYAIIENVVTHSDHRHHGYASALMRRAGEVAQKCGCYKVMLMTGSRRPETLRFYEQCGFDPHEKKAFILRMP